MANVFDIRPAAMTANVDRFVQYLLMKCERTGTTDFVDRLLGMADDLILKGKGAVGFLQAVSANGKSVTQAENLSAAEVGFACERALQLFNDEPGSQPVTFLDFSQMR